MGFELPFYRTYQKHPIESCQKVLFGSEPPLRQDFEAFQPHGGPPLASTAQRPRGATAGLLRIRTSEQGQRFANPPQPTAGIYLLGDG